MAHPWDVTLDGPDVRDAARDRHALAAGLSVDALIATATGELDQLITRVSETPAHEVGLCYIWDRQCRSWRVPEGEAFPGHSLRVAIDPDREIGALSYHHYQHELLDSHNPHTTEETPHLRPLETRPVVLTPAASRNGSGSHSGKALLGSQVIECRPRTRGDRPRTRLSRHR